MKIALMTWFNYINYGTALQVYASTKYLENNGYDIYVIQYYPKPAPMYFSSKFIEYFFRARRKFYKEFISRNILDATCTDTFKNFIKNNIKFTDAITTSADFKKINREFDAFICGSDQIWSPLNFDVPYFLDFVEDTNKMIAYAPSMGVSKIDRPGDDKKISELTNRFKYLSVREKTGADLIKSLNGRVAKVVLDPTLLLSKEDWDKYIPGKNEGKYLLAYFLRENEKYWKVVRKIAHELQLPIKVIPVFENDLKMPGAQKSAGPDEFVKLIRGASFICTDSFHGIAFSVNFNKQFLPFQRFASRAKDNQNSRVFDFLEAVGLKGRMYDGENVEKYLKVIDYGPVNEKLEALRKESREYLDGALEEIKENI